MGRKAEIRVSCGGSTRVDIADRLIQYDVKVLANAACYWMVESEYSKEELQKILETIVTRNERIDIREI